MVNLKRISQWLTLCCLVSALAKAEPRIVMKAGATLTGPRFMFSSRPGWSLPAIAPRRGVWEVEA